jgi:hypothetical protein
MEVKAANSGNSMAASAINALTNTIASESDSTLETSSILGMGCGTPVVGGAVCGVANAVAGGGTVVLKFAASGISTLRNDDYVTVDIGANLIPLPIFGLSFGPTFGFTRTRCGTLFFTAGVSAGTSGASGGVRAGYVNDGGMQESCQQVNNFIKGVSVTAEYYVSTSLAPAGPEQAITWGDAWPPVISGDAFSTEYGIGFGVDRNISLNATNSWQV